MQVVLDLDGPQVLEDHAGNETQNPKIQSLNSYNIKYQMRMM